LKKHLCLAATLLSLSIAHAQFDTNTPEWSAGTFSLGTRNTISLFDEDNATGKGIGGQFRLQLRKYLNSEWYFDYITSRDGDKTFRNDYHIGWSVMLYSKNNFAFDHMLQPYLIVGHCFDLSMVTAQNDKNNSVSRTSMATQAGIGTHVNITPRLDLSLSGQYMVHFGKDIHATEGPEGTIILEKQAYSKPDGHLLFTISFNYKFLRLW